MVYYAKFKMLIKLTAWKFYSILFTFTLLHIFSLSHKSEDIEVTAGFVLVCLETENSPKEIQNLNIKKFKSVQVFVLTYLVGFLRVFNSVFPELQLSQDTNQ